VTSLTFEQVRDAERAFVDSKARAASGQGTIESH
jgi:hypothetical protein